LHAPAPIAGLRSPGKGANRTILDCSFRLVSAQTRIVLPPRGAAGAGSLFWGPFLWAPPGAVPPVAQEERVGIV